LSVVRDATFSSGEEFMNVRAWVAFVLVALLTACGGGGGGGDNSGPLPCVAAVTPGPNPGDVGGPGGAAGVGDGGGDGAGSAGGVEGQFKRALIAVEQADGKMIGEAQVDDTYGMVRVELCQYGGPVKFTLKGRADGATVYYDEGKATELPFPANETIHVVIANYNKNVGITPLTEAAYQYLTAKYGADGWKDPAHVLEANEAIRTEFNRHLPAALQIEDITRLPAIIGPTTATGSLPASKNALYGTVISGLAQSAALFNVGEITPALTIARQIGLDLSDGKLDLFYCSNGDPANCTPTPVLDGRVFTSASSTYATAQFAEMVNTGISQISSRFGNTVNQGSVLRFTQIKIFYQCCDTGNGYTDTRPIFLLRNDGNVYFWPRRDRPMSLFATGYRQLYPRSSMLGSTRDGKVFFDPAVNFGDPNDPNAVATVSGPPTEAPQYFGTTRIAGLEETFISFFSQIVRKNDGQAYVDTASRLLGEGPVFGPPGGTLGPPVLQNIIDVSVSHADGGLPSMFAATADGRVYGWGWNSRGHSLGLGEAVIDDIFHTPQLNPFLRNIVSVSGCRFGGFAVDRAGKAWVWGGAGAGNTTGTAECAGVWSPVPIEAASINAFGSISQLQCSSTRRCIAMTRTGEVVAWGHFIDLVAAPPVPPTRVPLPAGRRAIYIGAGGIFVYALLDDGKILVFKSTPDQPTLIDTTGVPIS
jgi:hypothetical protein